MGPTEQAASSRTFARFAAFVALTVGLFVLAGWTLGLEQLTNIAPHWPRMPMLTAVAFLLGGMALWLTTDHSVRPALVSAGLVFTIGAVILVRDISGAEANLEQFTTASIALAAGGTAPARMAPATALGFVLLGLSLMLSMPRRTALWHQALAIGGVLVGWVGFSRYVFGGDALFAVANMAVHTALGCGFLEKVYARALMMELASRGIPFTREARFSIDYKGQPLGLTFCPDFVCFNTIIVETKALKVLTPIDLAQTLNYLKASKYKRALLLNFGAKSLEYRRLVM